MVRAYLTITGQKQGVIKGSVTQKGFENSILVHAFNQEVDSPRDPQSGLPTGARMHKPVTVVTAIDKSSPPLWNAMTTNENLTALVLSFTDDLLAPGGGVGLERQIYTIRLTNANIASIREVLADNQVPANQTLSLRREMTFTYQKIEWTWAEGGLAAADDWETRL